MMRQLGTAVAIAVLGGCAAGPNDVSDRAARRARTADSVMRAERGLWEAVRRQDSAAFAAILAPDYLYLSALGRRDRDRATEIGLHFGGGLRLDSLDLSHWRAVWVTDSVIVLDYLAKAWGVVGGQPDSQSGGALAVWSRRGGAWRAVVRTEWAVPWDGSNPSDSAFKRLQSRH